MQTEIQRRQGAWNRSADLLAQKVRCSLSCQSLSWPSCVQRHFYEYKFSGEAYKVSHSLFSESLLVLIIPVSIQIGHSIGNNVVNLHEWPKHPWNPACLVVDDLEPFGVAAFPMISQ